MTSAGAVSMDSSYLEVSGGDGGSSYSGNGGNGGNASVSIGGNLDITSLDYETELNIYGGTGGGAYYDTYPGVSGNGGNASLAVAGAANVDSSVVTILGGDAAYESFGDVGMTQGRGGDATASLGSLSLTSENYFHGTEEGTYAELNVIGGDGGNDDPYGGGDGYGNGGDGGNASLTSTGAVSIDSSSVSIQGGEGGYADSGNGGNGGNASLSSGDMSLIGYNWYSYIDVFGGDGGDNGNDYAGGNGGDGGNASLTANSLTVLGDYETGIEITGGDGGSVDYWNDEDQGMAGKGGDASLTVTGAVSMDYGYIDVDGGDAGDGALAADDQEAAGGNATANVGSLALVDDSYMEVIGGDGGSDDGDGDGVGYGNGGNGGNASLTSAGAVSIDSSSVSIQGGEGGYADSGNGGNGGNASFSAGAVSLIGYDGESYIEDYGGNGGNNGNDYAGGNGGDGGNASFTATSLTVLGDYDTWIDVIGGDGGSVDYTYEDYQGMGGKGGDASLTVTGAVSMDYGDLYVDGGDAGYGALPFGQQEAAGGNATANLGSLSLVDGSYLEVIGGDGGNDDPYGYEDGYGDGGDGGNAGLLVSGAVSIDSASVSVLGGNGGYGDSGNGGNGGSALVSIGGDLTMTYTYEEPVLYVLGGDAGGNNGDDYYGESGNGGNADLTVAGAVSVSGGYIDVAAGSGSLGYGDGVDFPNDGPGGNATLSAGSLTSVDSEIDVNGGDGGYDNIAGNGGNGGDAMVNVTGAVSLDDSYLGIAGGDGGSSYDNVAGNGGNATLTAAAVTLNNGSEIEVDGGYAAYGDTDGMDGSAMVSIGSLNLVDSDSSFYAESEDNTYGGNAVVTLGALNGAGYLYVWGENNSTLQVGSGNFSGVIAGDETLEKVGVGTLTLTGTNTYSGATTLTGGTLNIQGDSSLGTSYTLYLNGGTLQAGADMDLNQDATLLASSTVDVNSFSVTWDGGLTGSGALTVTDSSTGGVLNLPWSNDYTGGTNILGGTVAAGDSDALGTGDVNVNGGTLSTNSATSGTPLALNVGGNYTQSSTGSLNLGLAGAGSNDSLNVAGSANLAGTLNVNSIGGYAPTIGDTFMAITAIGGVNGTFGTYNSYVSGVRLLPIYQPYEVDLETLPGSFAALGANSNQSAVGGALDGVFSNSTYYNLMLALGAQSTSELQHTLSLIDPAVYTPVYQIGFATAESEAELIAGRLEAIMGAGGNSAGMAWNFGDTPLFAGKMSAKKEKAIADSVKSKKKAAAEAPAPAASEDSDKQEFSLYGGGIGNLGSVNGTANAAGYTYNTFGGFLGGDMKINKNWAAGLMLAFTSTSTGNSAIKVTGEQVGLYGGWHQDKLHAEALIDGGLNSYNTIHTSYGGNAANTNAGAQFGFQVGGGYDFGSNGLNIGPFVDGRYTYVQVNAFNESGPSVPLSFASQGEGCFTTDLGVKAGKSFELGGSASLTPNVSVAWQHIYSGNLDSMSASFGTASFTVNGPALGTDGAKVGLGADLKFSKDVSAFAQYQGKLAVTNYDLQNFNAGVNIGF
ncbi:MAG TPA: autotransporter domain-containing protein [bacterium]|nr:autotransporter domain-containing protein [bacterium]